MTPDQRAELAALMAQTLEDAGLAEEMERLGESALRHRRPDLDWTGSERMSGEDPMGMGDATTALEELADLAELEAALRQDYPGARLDDVDEEAVRRALGRQAVDDLAGAPPIERELEQPGLPQPPRRRPRAHPEGRAPPGRDRAAPGVRLAGGLRAPRRPRPDRRRRRRRADRRQPSLAVRRRAAHRRRPHGVQRRAPRRVRGHGVRLSVDDFEVAETERRTAAAVCLLVDLSYSMALRGTWGAAKQTALALHALVATQVSARTRSRSSGSPTTRGSLQPTDLAGLDWDMVQGTNLHHALLIAGRHLDKHPEHDPIILVITDGEPTAHLLRDGRSSFDWPPSRETLELTLAEVDKMTRRRATINVFMLADDERLVSFVEEVARRNGGRVFSPTPDRLGEFVVSDYLRVRRGTRR